ncbi:amino acid adenylation domain-containing protein [Robiginitalea marina]|uniref:Amino acid adenylation domain-containing protein n=1 Tax=Robiginitalea marina TaxID=2954105 RepID=A0ABT1AUL2_9FLAO|nr:amino acid adenylation domain-containing protein [Robiginitalea marina]MCO5723315.1 amino acid adenylation domain-containing protein [Robiginitalea marina]
MKINLIEYFEETAMKFPERTALVDGSSSWSFKELRSRSVFIGEVLANTYKRINRPVAVYLPKSNEAISIFLGTMYSGNCYAPLDAKAPMAKIETILKNLDPLCVITNTSLLPNLREINAEFEIINIDDLEYVEVSPPEIFRQCIDFDPAYILHTSGSTGVPKGVVISHLSIIDYMNWVVDTFGITEEERVGNQTPFIFDMSTLDIYLMIFAGASVFLIPEQHFIFPAKLLEYINEHHINLIFWVPSVFVNIANLRLLDSIKTPTIKKVLFGGEVMPPKHLEYWIQSLRDQNVIYGNLYGPTEITGTCACYVVDETFDPEESVPIGKPCRNTDILVLNERNELCEIGERGELCVRGSSLALGYWRDFKKTESVFVQNPLNTSFPERIYRTGDIVYTREDGQMMYVGRKDFQIKLHGYRIDLGEIEHNILSAFDTINAGVFFDQNKREIVLCYESDEEISIKEFRVKLSTVLSKQMIPTRYIRMESLPKSPSGKIDRSYLNDKINGNN